MAERPSAAAVVFLISVIPSAAALSPLPSSWGTSFWWQCFPQQELILFDGRASLSINSSSWWQWFPQKQIIFQMAVLCFASLYVSSSILRNSSWIIQVAMMLLSLIFLAEMTFRSHAYQNYRKITIICRTCQYYIHRDLALTKISKSKCKPFATKTGMRSGTETILFCRWCNAVYIRGLTK